VFAHLLGTLELMPPADRARLKALTPAAYTGLAAEMARSI